MLAGLYAVDPTLCGQLFNATLNHPSVTVHNASVAVIQDDRCGGYNATTGQVVPWSKHVLIGGVVAFAGPLGYARIHLHSHLLQRPGSTEPVNNITLLVYGLLGATYQVTKDYPVWGPSRRGVQGGEDKPDAVSLGDFGCEAGGSRPCPPVPLVPESLSPIRFHQARMPLPSP